MESGRVLDKLKNEYVGNPKTLYVLLSHYAKADEGPHVEKLIRFSDLAGGHAYGATFTERAEVPIAEMFGSKPDKLLEAARALDGVEAKYGDSSVEIPALPRVPLVHVVWKGDEFPASCSILMYASANHYLPTEDIAVLGEITTARLKSSLERLL